MRTVVITGGTDGMGAALARHHLKEGDRVAVVGRSHAKFEALLAALEAEGTPATAGRARFLAADLSLRADNELVIGRLKEHYERIDVLVLAASYIRQKRHVTAEGREASWMLFFVSKYLFVTGLAARLAAADRPVIVNMAVPGTRPDAIDFGDLELAGRFTFAKANATQRRANELLGILAARNPDLSYVTWGPRNLVKTGFAGETGRVMRWTAALLAPLIGQDPGDAVRPVIRLIDGPSPGRAAYRGAKRVGLAHGPDDERDAERLARAVDTMLTGRPTPPGGGHFSMAASWRFTRRAPAGMPATSRRRGRCRGRSSTGRRGRRA